MVIRLKSADSDSVLSQTAQRLLVRELRERALIDIVKCETSADIILAIEPGTDTEGYNISRQGKTVHITGNDAAGLLYGVGRFLHESVSAAGQYEPCGDLGKFAPDCNIRGMYFAHNFHNWYRLAPLADLVRYVEDLALWGLNTIVFPCDTNPHCSVDEIENVMLPKQLQLIAAAKRCGIRIGMLTVANTLLTEPESSIAATPVPDTNPERRGNIGHRVCPSTADGMASLVARYESSLDVYRDVGLDYEVAFPYDEGGCGCEQCRPWGANGYIKACKALSRLAKTKYPDCHFIAGTWCFDVLEKPEGEYQGLDQAIREDAGWCDGVMCDAHGMFPKWPLAHGAPGGLPMVNFPEISMWGRFPWGGSGANPFPRRIANNWGQSSHLLSGGFPYSEGRFEDINKVICLGLFWDKNADWRKILRTYIRYEFGHAAIDSLMEAITIMEDIYQPHLLTREKAERVLSLVEQVAQNSSETVLRSWRWRLLYLRAVIDVETTTHPDRTGIVSDKQKACFEELVRLYCAENAESAVRPLGN